MLVIDRSAAGTSVVIRALSIDPSAATEAFIAASLTLLPTTLTRAAPVAATSTRLTPKTVRRSRDRR